MTRWQDVVLVLGLVGLTLLGEHEGLLPREVAVSVVLAAAGYLTARVVRGRKQRGAEGSTGENASGAVPERLEGSPSTRITIKADGDVVVERSPEEDPGEAPTDPGSPGGDEGGSA